MSQKFTVDEETIIEELGLASSADDFKQQTLQKIGELLDERVKLQIDTHLSDDEVVELDAIGDDQEKFVAYIQAHIPDLDKMVQDELVAIIEELRSFLS